MQVLELDEKLLLTIGVIEKHQQELRKKALAEYVACEGQLNAQKLIGNDVIIFVANEKDLFTLLKREAK